jgi:subtilisin family serine protease
MTGTENDYSPEAKGLTGKNVIIGEVDSGLDLNHCYFYDSSTALQLCTPGNPTASQCTTPNNNHRKVVGYYAYSDSADYSGHGTHVGGTIAGSPFTTAIGDVATHIGVAKDAKLAMFDVEQSVRILILVLPFFFICFILFYFIFCLFVFLFCFFFVFVFEVLAVNYSYFSN